MTCSSLRNRRAFFGTASVIAVSTLALATSNAAAQTAPQPAEIDEITVTASRVSGFTAPTPTATLSIETIARTAPVSVTEILQQVPSFRTSTQNSTAASFANLRGIGASRTLVLLDGRRQVPSFSDGAFDLGTIPTALLKRVEVVTGGASASWGSDAVAGVVNLILRDDLDGVTGEVQYGISKYNDSDNKRVSLAAGTTFAGGRGRIMVGGEYAESKGVPGLGPPWLSRPWSGRGVVGNSAYATNGLPGTIFSPDVRASVNTNGGLITAGPLRGLQFLDNGATSQFQYGTVYGTDMIGGGDNFGLNQAYAVTIINPYENRNLFGRVNFDVTPDVRVFAEAGYARSISNSVTGAAVNRGQSTAPNCTNTVLASATGSINVNINNPFLPASVRQQMQAAGITCFAMGKNFIGSGLGNYGTSDGTPGAYRGLAGFRANLPHAWTLDGYVGYGRSGFRSRRFGNVITQNLRNAVDATTNGAGQIVCRINADAVTTNDDPACRPINLFGPNAASAESAAYISGVAKLDMDTYQTVGAINLAGDLYRTWAGPIGVALGAEYRKERVEAVSDPISQASGFVSGNRGGLSGQYDVKEIYGEMVVPLLRDAAIAQSLDANFAARYTDYSSSGGVTTWKAGGTWDVNDHLRVRMTRSRDIRAGNLGELFTPVSTANQGLRDPRNSSQVALQVRTQGNSVLAPEVADTFTGGFVVQPGWAPGLRASIDYYNISIKGAIGVESAQLILDRCFIESAQDACSQVTLANNVITSVTRRYANQDRFETSGVDIELGYRRSVSDLIGRDGDINVTLLANYVEKLAQTVAATAATTDPAGQYGNPHWSANGAFTYREGPLSVTVEERFYGGGRIDNTKIEGAATLRGININQVGRAWYTNLAVSYDFKVRAVQQLQAYVRVNNLFNRAPPFPSPVRDTNNVGAQTNLFDQVGRAYRVGIRFSF